MLHNGLPQTDKELNGQQKQRSPTISRRSLLKHAIFAGSISVASARVEGTGDSSEYSDVSGVTSVLDRPRPGPFDKELIVEGVGDASSHYQFSINDAVTVEHVVKAEVKHYDEPLIMGEIQSGETEVYYFSGKVTKVDTQGGIRYYIRE